MSTLYDRSQVSIWKASLSLQHVAGDDAFLESACFDTQQAIEFILKFILSEHGANYKRHMILDIWQNCLILQLLNLISLLN